MGYKSRTVHVMGESLAGDKLCSMYDCADRFKKCKDCYKIHGVWTEYSKSSLRDVKK